MSELLKLAQLPKNDRVAEMDVEACRIDAKFDAKRFSSGDAALEFLSEFRFRGDPVHAAVNDGQLFFDRSHQAFSAQVNI
jgi:hypothetical protein